MDSMWTESRFMPANDEDLANGAWCHDAHMLQELIRLNEFMKKQTDFSGDKLPDNVDVKEPKNQSNYSEKRAKPDAREVHIQSITKSISSLEGKNISSSVTVLNVHSKTTLKTTEGKDKVPRASTPKRGERSPNKKNRSPKVNSHPHSKYESFGSPRRDRRANSTFQTEFRVSPKGTCSVYNRNTVDSLFNCPFELVELYSSKKGKSESDSSANQRNSMVSSPRNDGKIVSVDADFLSPEMKKKRSMDPKNIKTNSEDVKLNRRQQVAVQKNNLNLGKVQENSNESSFEKSIRVKNSNKCNARETYYHENGSQMLRLQLPDTGIEDNKYEDNASTLPEETNEITIIADRTRTMEEKSASITEEREKPEKFIAASNDEKLKRDSPRDKTMDENDLPGKEECKTKRQDVKSDSNPNESSTDSESKMSKSTMESEESNSFGDLKTESSSIDNVEGSKEVRPNPEDLKEESAENKFKIIIEKRMNKPNDVKKRETKIIDANLCTDNVQPMGRKDEGQEFQDSCNKSMRFDTQDATRGITFRESSRNIDCEDANICRMLTKIHERLAIDWQRMMRLQMKLQSTVCPDSANTMMLMLQLLDKTIARCKSYIHGSNDGFEAETSITKLLSKNILDLVKVVNKNRITLEDQEKRVDQMQLELLQGRHAPKKRSILNEITLTSNYWANEISCIIETMSRLVKNVMAENEEKENVRSPRKSKASQRRVFTSSSANDTKQKVGHVRTRSARPNVAKKESAVGTQMSCVSNSVNTLRQSRSKTYTKSFGSARSPRREKHPDNIQTNTDKKTVDNSRHWERIKSSKIALNASSSQYKQTVSRQKHRAPGNQPQPWKPGGGPVSKMPASNSVITLLQKPQKTTHLKENAKSTNKRGNSMDHILTKKNLTNMDDNGKRTTRTHNYTGEKQRNEAKRKPSETYSTKTTVPVLNIDNLNAGDRSSISLKASSMMKPKPKTSARSYNESLRRGSSDHACPRTFTNSSCEVDRKSARQSEILRELEEIIKDAPKEEDKDSEDSHFYQLCNETSSVSFDSRRSNLFNEIPNDEEPTRDVDYYRFDISEMKLSERFFEDSQMMDKISEKSSVPVNERESMEFSSLTNVKDDSQPGAGPLETSASCTPSVGSSSSSNLCCQEKTVTRDDKEAQKHDIREPRNVNSLIKKDKIRMNPHAVSLSMLKDFLCDQGIDVDLVNKAEKNLKDKQKTYLKRKSISFANVPTNDDNFLRVDSKKELKGTVLHLQEMKDNATCTIISCSNAYSQTIVRCMVSKSLQTIPNPKIQIWKPAILRAIETQTELKARNACSMTDDFDQEKNLKHQDFPLKNSCPFYRTSSRSADFEEKISRNNEGSKECSHVLQELLLNRLKEESNESLSNVRPTDSNESLSISYSDSSVESSKKFSANEEEDQKPVNVISSEIVAALRLAEIRGRNVCKALEIYRRTLRNKVKKLKKRTKRRKTISKILKGSKEECRSLSGSDSVKMIAQKKNKKRNEIIEALRQAELASTFSKTSFDPQSESQEEYFESVGPSTVTPSSSITGEFSNQLVVQRKSSSSVTARDVRSLIEFLIDETSDVKFESTEGTNLNVCAVFYGNTDRRFSLLSRENILLPLIYGILCYVVFWCLQFTIVCDVS
ncbi:uncharacterized protein LOC113464096 [Ceratina calcarata]|uniref:Uncharacterized protein LOC113464096 n=1 Tax=Ceratina calcarata TaxID=156304 RepID=A0AAJ7RY39_9HYME|nr:uncharacterized protein LOC113464096 [Ceratina calcarata]